MNVVSIVMEPNLSVLCK